ncbi:hypothetical protein ACLB2K_003679 [Fragaria x ananassa]
METFLESPKLQALFIIAFLFSPSISLKIGETCSVDKDCDAGLSCQTCAANGNTRPRCTRIQPTNPTSKVKGLPFNKYTWLTTHNSYAQAGVRSSTGNIIIAPMNQNDTVTSQLQKLAVDVLKEIQAFLVANPSEIVTIFIEDYVTSPSGLSKVFDAAGLKTYMFPISRMPKDGKDWPTVDDMAKNNQRLVVFTSKSSKEASDGIAYEWNYVVENQYGNGGMALNSCPNRAESSPMNTTSKPLVLVNYFRDVPNASATCVDNSAPLLRTLKTCYDAAGKRWPNFIAVDYYQKSDGGGAAEAVDKSNGQLTCGCDSITYCKVNATTGNATFGSCDVPKLAPPPPASLGISPPPPSGPSSNFASQNSKSVMLRWLCGTILAATLSMWI